MVESTFSEDFEENFKPDISFDVIQKAVAGDKDAIAQALAAYEPLIIAHATVKDETGTHIDEDLAQHLRLAMLEAIPNFPLEKTE